MLILFIENKFMKILKFGTPSYIMRDIIHGLQKNMNQESENIYYIEKSKKQNIIY